MAQLTQLDAKCAKSVKSAKQKFNKNMAHKNARGKTPSVFAIS